MKIVSEANLLCSAQIFALLNIFNSIAMKLIPQGDSLAV